MERPYGLTVQDPVKGLFFKSLCLGAELLTGRGFSTGQKPLFSAISAGFVRNELPAVFLYCHGGSKLLYIA